MPRTAKILKKKLKAGGNGNEDLAEMFNQMLGAGNVNLDIVYPKYIDLIAKIKASHKLIKILSNILPGIPEFDLSKKELNEYIDINTSKIEEKFTMTLDRTKPVSNEDREKFGAMYEELKADDIVLSLIVICNRLIKDKKHIGTADKVGYQFILNKPGMEYCVFSFSSCNLAYMLSLREVPEDIKKLTVNILHKLYTSTYSIYKIISSPDLDVDKFVDVIMSNIQAVKSQIPRCDKAFREITNSVHMLKDNFGSYYKDFIQTKNQTIIMENFILDVSKKTKVDPQTTLQFRKIISYYRKIAQNKIKDPRVKKLFDKIGANLDKLDSHSNIKAHENDSEPDENTDSSNNTANSTTESSKN